MLAKCVASINLRRFDEIGQEIGSASTQMGKKLNILANGQPFRAFAGDLILDAALHQGIDLPHDCRAGQCGSCLIRVLQGQFLGGETKRAQLIHACQARVFSDAEIEFDKVSPRRQVTGSLATIESLAPDVYGLTIRLDQMSRHRPGQYYRFKFRGFPGRCFSPTAPFAGRDSRRTLRLHVKIVKNGQVSSRLGVSIVPGHKVRIEGPFGSAFFRRGKGRRLVLVASGTGFAPIWAIAHASVRANPARPLLLVAGARRLSGLYMVPALRRLSVFPAAAFIATAHDAQSAAPVVRCGTPLQHLPALTASDLVYAAGPPELVEGVAERASQAGAEFYADPFIDTAKEAQWRLRCQEGFASLKSRLSEWLGPRSTEEDLWGCDLDADPYSVSQALSSAENFRREAAGAFRGQGDPWGA